MFAGVPADVDSLASWSGFLMALLDLSMSVGGMCGRESFTWYEMVF